MPGPYLSQHIPDARFPGDLYDIPFLRLDLQPIGLDLPFVIWGSTSRRASMRGTWGFYTDDYRFTGLWTAPQRLLNTFPTAIVEPNLSVHDTLPEALAIAATYKKRWLSRLYQDIAGIKIWVDLNVGRLYKDLNMVGVPKGWRAFATRGYAANLDDLETEYQLAALWADPAEPVFLVYGGGKKVREYCQERRWLWCSEQADIASKRPIAVDPFVNFATLEIPEAIKQLQLAAVNPVAEDG